MTTPRQTYEEQSLLESAMKLVEDVLINEPVGTGIILTMIGTTGFEIRVTRQHDQEQNRLNAAYLAGFNASGENSTDDPRWIADRDKNLKGI